MSREQQVRRIAEGYRRQGYDVTIDPTPAQMPARLAWLRADLIAERGDEHVLVLVEGHDDELQIVADALHEVGGWRLDVHALED